MYFLDADILCTGKIDELLTVDISRYCIAAVKDIKSEECLKNIGLDLNNTGYFNSGVMLINIRNWQKENTFKQFMQLIYKDDYKYPDQDVLNIIFNNKVLFLNNKFNYVNAEDEGKVFIHYTSAVKPWHLAHDFNINYIKYLWASPWADLNLKPSLGYKPARKYARILWKTHHPIGAIKWFFIYLLRKSKVS